MTLRLTGALLGGALLLTAGAAFARSGDPLPGIDVSMEQNPGGIIIATTTTNGTGEYTFKSVPPGTYVLRYKSGPDKGKVLKNLTVRKAGSVSGKILAKADSGQKSNKRMTADTGKKKDRNQGTIFVDIPGMGDKPAGNTRTPRAR